MQTNLSDLIAPVFYKLHHQIKNHEYTHYWFRGGRGSTKSSLISIEIILGMMRNPDYNAIVFRNIELKKFIGKVMTVGERISEFKRAIIECLMVNPYIKSINSINITRDKTNIDCEIDLTTVYGELVINV